MGAPVDGPGPAAVPHRALIFFQQQAFLDIVEELLRDMGTVTFLRLDGRVPVGERRQAICTAFNTDPTIDVLLLTTRVGGLGLNLTGADTVIFMEHDWNPAVDLQAMDRAHRLGQTRAVNVYRFITRGTVEEKILGLQQFKTAIAKMVVSADNTSLQSMSTDQVVDLMRYGRADDAVGAREDGAAAAAGAGEASSGASDDDAELREREAQYKAAFSVDAFLTSMSDGSKAQ